MHWPEQKHWNAWTADFLYCCCCCCSPSFKIEFLNGHVTATHSSQIHSSYFSSLHLTDFTISIFFTFSQSIAIQSTRIAFFCVCVLAVRAHSIPFSPLFSSLFFLVSEWDGDVLEISRISRLDMGSYLCIGKDQFRAFKYIFEIQITQRMCIDFGHEMCFFFLISLQIHVDHLKENVH